MWQVASFVKYSSSRKKYLEIAKFYGFKYSLDIQEKSSDLDNIDLVGGKKTAKGIS